MKPGWVAALAPAKVNPWLRILGKRADGYHGVDTALLALDWCDRVRARGTTDGELHLALGGPALSDDVPADERNLAFRAAKAVLAEAVRRGEVEPGAGVELQLEKHIPSRAGLGGGSADAVAAALATHGALGLDANAAWRAELERIAVELGSDTAFFAAAPDGYAHCTGRGELVRPLALGGGAGLVAAVITPGVEASTAAVYAALGGFPEMAEPSDSSLSGTSRGPRVESSFLDQPLDSIRAGLVNDLESAALAAVPELVTWRDVLDQSGAAHFRLSGSGSSFFGLFGDAHRASRCLTEIESLARARGLSVRAARTARPAGHGAVLATSRS